MTLLVMVEGSEIVATAEVSAAQIATGAAGSANPWAAYVQAPWPVSNATHYYVAPDFIAYTEAQVAAKAVRPSYPCEWSNAAMAWVDARTLQEAKDARWAELLIERAAREFSTFTWDGSVFDCDSESQTRIIGSATLAIIASMTAQPFSIDWTLADDTVRALSGPDMLNVGAALGAHVTAVHDTSRALHDQIEAATTNAQVEAVVWP